jgi:DnaK suppressor protein
MDLQQKKELKIDIQERIEKLKESIKILEEVTKPIAPDNAIGRITRMDAIQMRGIKEANLETSKHTLYKLEQALECIDLDTFGVCQYCKKRIGFERIKALPETNKCIVCAEKYSI